MIHILISSKGVTQRLQKKKKKKNKSKKDMYNKIFKWKYLNGYKRQKGPEKYYQKYLLSFSYSAFISTFPWLQRRKEVGYAMISHV